MFKNLRVATRLYLCFSSVIAIFIITIGIMAINFNRVVESNNWNIHTYKVLMASRDITASLINMETGHRGFLLTGDENFLEPFNNGIKEFSEHYNIGKSLTSDNPKQQERFEKLLSDKNSLVDDFMVPLINDKKNGINITNEKLGAGKKYMDGIRATLSELAGAEEGLLIQRSADLENLISLNLILMLILGSFSTFLGVLLSLLLARSISKQLGCEPSDVAYISGKIADGDLNFNLNIDSSKPNGAFANILRMITSLKEKGEIINRIAEGNLTDQVSLASENDNLGKALAKMLESLNQILTQVSLAIGQFRTGTEQISDTSQSLSQGATEQAASLEEITSSVNVINGRSRDNSRNSEQAQIMANQAKEAAETGYMQMKEVVSSMKEINKSAEGIKRIAKAIDDIASQINLLALNANVEAARAGEYGRGFAVVADEVRNLASRSASSVKGATELVDEAIKNINTGNKLAELTSSQIESIVTIATNVSAIATEVTSASIEQSQELNQISLGLDQIDKVTQGNTAIFEETAAASENLAHQALELNVLMGRFKIRN